MRRFSYSFLIIGFFLTAIGLAGCSPSAPTFKSLDISDVEWGGDFELTAHTGERVRFSDSHGKVLILFFGFTRCPDICSPTLAKLALLEKRLGEDADRVQVLFVTVDPEFDTPEQLAAFVPKFDPSFIGLTGTVEEIAALAKEYKITYQFNPRSSSAQTLIDHSGGMMVKDAEGKLRLLIRNDASVEDMEHDVRLLLKEKSRS